MRTVLRCEKQEVIADPEGTFTVIEEKINPTGRKKLAEALSNHNYDNICSLAVRQVTAGADILDIDLDAPGIDDVAVLPEVALVVAETVDAPLCLDSANRQALAASLCLEGEAILHGLVTDPGFLHLRRLHLVEVRTHTRIEGIAILDSQVWYERFSPAAFQDTLRSGAEGSMSKTCKPFQACLT